MAKKVEKRVPDVRFKGFTDDWERRKGKDYLSESFIPGNTGSNSRKLTVKLWGKGVVKKQVIGNGSKNTKYYLRKPGQLIYGKLDFIHAAFGIVPKELIGYESTIDSPAFDITDGSPIFLLNLFLRREFYERFGLMANGSRRAKRIHEKDFLNMPFFAGSYNEQKKIGEIILKISNLITLQHKKLEQLRLFRKAMLQQLFANNNEKSPHIFLKAFNEEWKNHKLSWAFSERKERSGTGQLLSVSISNGVHPFDEELRKNNSSKDKSHYKIVQKGDIAYNSMRMWQGAEGISNYDGIVSPAYTVLSPNKGINALFFNFMFKRTEMLRSFQRHSQGLTSDTWNLKYPLLKEITIKAPDKKEQELLGALLFRLDMLIDKKQKSLSQFMTLKKFLLQKMFI